MKCRLRSDHNGNIFWYTINITKRMNPALRIGESRPLMSQILSAAVMSVSLAATMTDGAPPSKQVSGVSRGSPYIGGGQPESFWTFCSGELHRASGEAFCFIPFDLSDVGSLSCSAPTLLLAEVKPHHRWKWWQHLAELHKSNGFYLWRD